MGQEGGATSDGLGARPAPPHACNWRKGGRNARFSLLGNLPGSLIGLFSTHPHPAVLLPPVSLGFCPPQPYREPEASVAEPPSCPLALDMSLRDSSYGVASGPCAVAQLPPEDVNHLTDPQSRDQGFLRTKMKVTTFIPS